MKMCFTMINLNDYIFFAYVVEKKSFTNAAKALKVPKSKVSRHIKELESRLQTRLIERTSRKLSVTSQGEILYQHAKRLIDEVEQAEDIMKKAKTR